MEMAIYFLSLFYELSELERKLIIRNIFFIDDVSEYAFFLENKNVYFNFYVGSVYYRYVFCLKDSRKIDQQNSKYVTFFHENRIYCYLIFPLMYNPFSNYSYSFDILSKIFLASSKKEVNVLLHQLL